MGSEELDATERCRPLWTIRPGTELSLINPEALLCTINCARG